MLHPHLLAGRERVLYRLTGVPAPLDQAPAVRAFAALLARLAPRQERKAASAGGRIRLLQGEGVLRRMP